MAEEQRTYWNSKVENGLLNLLDPEKEMYAYVKWDGSVHLWYYEKSARTDTSVNFDHDTGIEDHSDWGFEGDGHHDFYRVIDIDEEIARLQSLKDTATAWFAEQGKRWPPDWEAYRTGRATLEQAQHVPPRQAGKEESC